MVNFFVLLSLAGTLLMPSGIRQASSNQTHAGGSMIWEFDNLERIGGHKATVLGNPVVIETEKGRAVAFDGTDDAIILDANPLAGARQFTVEVIFRPDAGGPPEQRFLHMQETDDRRVLIETRLTRDSRWFLDTFIKSDESEKTLYSERFPHPIGVWYLAALVYQDNQMRHYINGAPELSGSVDYLPVQGGRTSIGCRLNRVFWFKGAIKRVRVTHRALSPREFMTL
ncbi:MAG: LamG domain-containing protein [Acidobacteriota bacterium]